MNGPRPSKRLRIAARLKLEQAAIDFLGDGREFWGDSTKKGALEQAALDFARLELAAADTSPSLEDT